jgi:hypothetical protein
MILENGTIQIESKTGGGLGTDGYPVAPAGVWLGSIPACVVPANLDYQAKSANENAYVGVSYTVLIEYDERHFALLQKSERIWINWQGISGEFSVIRIDLLMAVDVIKITV